MIKPKGDVCCVLFAIMANDWQQACDFGMKRKTGPHCTVCMHRERAQIDLGLARRVSVIALSKRFGLGHDSLYRHRANHMTPQLRASLLAGPEIELDLDRL